MPRTDRLAKPESASSQSENDPMALLARMTSGLLDQYRCEKHGYNPYDTSAGRKPDIWLAKRKRA
jgi:hypothetical protein